MTGDPTRDWNDAFDYAPISLPYNAIVETVSLDKLYESFKTINETYPWAYKESSVFGMPIYTLPPEPLPPPKLQLNELKFDDGTDILSKDFTYSFNRWLEERFGREEAKEEFAYIFENYGIALTKESIVKLNIVA